MEGYQDENGNPINVQEELNLMGGDQQDPYANLPVVDAAQEDPFTSAVDQAVAEVGTPQPTVSPTQTQQSNENQAQQSSLNYTPALSQIQDIPVFGQLAAYGAIAASKPADMSFDEWYDIQQKQMARYNAENPKMAPLTSGIASGAFGGVAGKALGSLGAIGRTFGQALMPTTPGAMAVSGAAVASQQPQYSPEERGVLPSAGRGVLGGALGYGVGKFAQMGRPELGIEAALANKEIIEKPIPKSGRMMGWYINKSKEKMGPESIGAIEKLEANPARFRDVTNTTEARTQIAQETQDTLKEIVEISDDKIRDIDNLATQFDESVKLLANRSKELQEPSDMTSTHAREMHDAFIDNVLKPEYARAWAYLPTTDVYASNPKAYGYPLKNLISAFRSAKFAEAKFKTGPNAALERNVNAVIENDTERMISGAIDSARKLTGLQEAASFVRRNRAVLTDPQSIDKPEVQKMMIESFTTPEEVRRLIQFVDNVDPDYVHKRLSDLFDGYKIERGVARNTSEQIRKSSQASVAFGKIHHAIRDGISKHYANENFDSISKAANEINTKFVLPLKAKIPMVGTREDMTISALKNSVASEVSQVYKTIEEAAARGLADPDLIKYAKSVHTLGKIFTDGKFKGMSADEAASAIAEGRFAAAKYLEAIAKTDPQLSGNLTSTTQLAQKLVAAKENYNNVISSAKGLFPEIVKKLKSSRGPSSVTSMIEQAAGPGTRNVDTSKLESDALIGLENIFNYKFSGDKSKVADAIEKLRRIREVEALNIPTKSAESYAGRSAARAGVWAIGGRGAFALTEAMAYLTAKFSSGYTGGKWTQANPYIIEKYLQDKVANKLIDKRMGAWAEAVGDNGPSAGSFVIAKGSPDLMYIINDIMKDKSLSPIEKKKAVDKINENGIEVEMNDNGQ
jgi:hypothetical protein